MNFFDKNILLFLNSFVDRCPSLDLALVQFQQNDLLKGAVFIALFWCLWFSPMASESAGLQKQQKLFGAICAVVVGVIAARLMADLLPFRPRPLTNPALHLRVPGDIVPVWLATWSSFPSDHAVVWFALVVGIYRVNKQVGVLTGLYASLLGVGRVYMGIHHPTDIMAGAGIGAGLALLFSGEYMRAKLFAFPAKVLRLHPGWFYACMFLATYEIANLFNEVRSMGSMAWRIIKILAH